MFKVLVLIVSLILIYFLLTQEKRGMKISVLTYFSLLSVVFMSGLLYISSAYQLYDNPIEGGFSKQYDWVSLFSYVYLIPLVVLIGYKLFKFTLESFGKTWIKIAMCVLWMGVLAATWYVLTFIFTLVFYGFAP